MNSRDRHLKGIEGIAVFLVQWPTYFLVEGLHGSFRLLRHVPHYRGDHFAFVELFFTLDNVLW